MPSAIRPPPIEAAFRELWPEPKLMNLLDDSLSADLARDGALTPAMTDRFLALAGYAVGTGAMASCSPARPSGRVLMPSRRPILPCPYSSRTRP